MTDGQSRVLAPYTKWLPGFNQAARAQGRGRKNTSPWENCELAGLHSAIVTPRNQKNSPLGTPRVPDPLTGTVLVSHAVGLPHITLEQ